MASVITQAELIAATLDRADMTNSSFPDTEQVNRYINNAMAELYEILVTHFEDYFYTVEDITLVGDTESYNLPTKYFKTLKMFYLDGGNRIRLERFTMEELSRDEFYDYTYTQGYGRSLKYRVMGSKVLFVPKPISSGTVEHWYIPEITKFVEDPTDPAYDAATAITFNVPANWEEFIPLSAAIKLIIKEESDPSALMMQKQEYIKRLMLAVPERDAGEPVEIQDHRRRFRRGRGRYF